MEKMYTFKKVLIVILILIIIGAVTLSIISTKKEAPVVIPDNVNNEQVEDVTPPEKTLDEKTFVEDYVKNNIVTLATNSAVLGGIWYVVEVNVNTETKGGEVTYEDGHIQSKATFSYDYTENPESVTIKNFVIKK